jgi:hypothetical protein
MADFGDYDPDDPRRGRRMLNILSVVVFAVVALAAVWAWHIHWGGVPIAQTNKPPAPSTAQAPPAVPPNTRRQKRPP